jgi:tetratricopeptide (TPR) repeat protein
MKKTTALWTLTILVSLSSGATAGGLANRSARSVSLNMVARMQAPPQAAKAPQWKSREEYDAYNAMATATDPDKKVSLAEAFIQKYPTSDFKSGALLTEMQVYASQSKTDKAVEVAKKVLDVDPDNLVALRFLSFTFPFLYKPTDADATSKLSRADGDAHHGLDLLQKLQKPAGATDEQFQQGVKEFRGVFNSCVGFAALQRKDYPNAITALKAATADNQNSWYAVYWMGLAYLYSTPRDYDHAIWYYARAVALAKAGKDPNATDWEKYLKQTYVGYHGTDTGLSDIETQAAATADPPDGFKVAHAEAPKHTGNNTVDAFNTLTYNLTLGGETAQKQWDGIKGQPVSNFGGTVVSVEKGTDPNSYSVHIAVLDGTKSAGGYDIELKDTTQPDVKNLQKGDLLTFKGTLDSYVATPNLILTLVGEVTSDLPDKPAAKPKPKAPVHHPVHKTTTN